MECRNICVLSFFQCLVELYPLPFPKARLAGAVYAAYTTEEGSTNEMLFNGVDGVCHRWTAAVSGKTIENSRPKFLRRIKMVCSRICSVSCFWREQWAACQ